MYQAELKRLNGGELPRRYQKVGELRRRAVREILPYARERYLFATEGSLLAVVEAWGIYKPQKDFQEAGRPKKRPVRKRRELQIGDSFI